MITSRAHSWKARLVVPFAGSALLVGALIGVAPAASAAPGDLTLASITFDGVKGDGLSNLPSMSLDGTLVAFTSSATNLDPRATDGSTNVYVKNLTSGDLTLVSARDDGVKANGGSGHPTISNDGRFVAFGSSATNLDPADADTIPDVYVKDLMTGAVSLVSVSSAGVKGNGWSGASGDLSISVDGSRVAFDSIATNLDPNDTDSSVDVYVKDITSGELTLASTADSGTKGIGSSFLSSHSLSADGTTVVFQSSADNLDATDADTTVDVYVKDLVTGDLLLVSSGLNGKGDASSGDASISGEGEFVAFASLATNFDSEDADGLGDVYLKNVLTGSLTLVSTSDAGEKGNAESRSPFISRDGTVIAFHSNATNLDPRDTDAVLDVYTKDWTTGDVQLASISAAGVKGDDSSELPALAGNASRVAFASWATNLDARDTDGLADVYVKELEASNTPPVAADDAYIIRSVGILVDPAPGVLGNDGDADGDALSAVQITGPSHGSVSLLSDGTLVYEANLGFTGTDSFTYVANDGSVDSNVATVTIRVNNRPVASNDVYSTNQGVDLPVAVPGVLGNDTDGDADALTAVLISGPNNGQVSLEADGSFLYEPDTGFNGTDMFAYVANDGIEDSEVAYATITVNPPPSCAGVCLSVDDVSVTEGSRGATRASFTIRLSAPSSSRVTVLVQVAGGTAISGSDYRPFVSRTVAIRRGRTTTTITVFVIGDRLPEPDETFFVQLSSPVNAGISDAQGIGTILNDD